MSGGSRKRSRPSAEDANNSFVMSVTSKVTSLLPATITKWFSGSGQNSSNGSAPTAEVTDSSSEEEPEIPSPITQPPQKRTRYNTQNHYNASETNCGTYSNESPESSSYNAGQSPLKKFPRDPNIISTPFRPPNEEASVDNSERDSTMSTSSFSYSTLGPPVLNKRKSLFKTSTRNNESTSAKPSHNTMVDPKQPCFKPSLLVSPFYPSRTTYGGASSQYINRPNIKQRKGTYVNELNSNESTTMSHSARRIMDLLEDYSSPIMEAKRIPQYNLPRKDPIASTSQQSNHKSLSHKTTEFHAPNIASILRLKQKSRLMNTTNAARQIIASHSSACHYAPYSLSPNRRSQTDVESRSKGVGTTTETQIADTSEQKNDKFETTPTFSPASLPTAVLQINKDNLPKFSFGINLSPIGASSTPKQNLSSKVEKTLPKVSEPTIISVTTEARTPISKSESTISKSSADSGNTFTFSSPVKVSFAMGSPKATKTPPKYTFGSPECGIDKENKKTNNLVTVVGEAKDTEKPEITKSNDWKCSDCWKLNEQEADKCVCCGGKKPSSGDEKNNKCSVCKLANSQSHTDKCINCEKVPTNSGFNSTTSVNSLKSTKWKCNDCWVENDENKEKCVCCGSKNPKMSSQRTAASSASTPVNSVKSTKWKCNDCLVENDENKEKCVCCGSKNPKMSSQSGAATPVKSAAASDWTCDDCWIKNKSSVDKCAACGGAKSGSKQNAAPMLSTNTSSSTLFNTFDNKSFKPLVASQNDKWECTSCLVRNDNDKVKCVCCEMERPGAEKKAVKTTFNFGTTTNTFKFGIDPKVQEANLAKPPEVKPIEMKAEESEKNNNVLPKAPPTFYFGIPPKKLEDQTDSTKIKISSFTPVTTADSTLSVQQTTKFTVPSFTFTKTDTTDDDEKPQEVPKVDFSFPTRTEPPASKPFGGLLGASSSMLTPTTTVQSSDTSLLNPAPNLEKKDAQTTQLPFQLGNATTSAPSPTQNKFTFSGSGLKPAANLFAKPASSLASTTISFTPPAQSSSTTTISALFQKPLDGNTPALSLFPKNETSTNSPLSLFQKPSAATTAAAPSLASTAPVFSFGTSTKVSSNFSFGNTQPTNNNESTANNSFKFFGSTPDKNNSSNKFSLGAASIGAGNALGSGNILGGGNALSSGNVLGTSLSGANSITSGNTEISGQNNQNDLQSGNSIKSPSSNIFGAPAQKENIWSQPSNPSSNLFGTNNASNSLQKPGAFTFGASNTAFGAQPSNPSGASTAFGAPQSAAPSASTFGVPQSAAPSASTFGAPQSAAPSASTFGAPQSAAPSASTFGAPQSAAPSASTFGAPQSAAPSASTFCAPQSAAPSASTFGAPQNNAAAPGTAFGAQPSNPTASSTPFSAQPSNPAPVFGSNAQPTQNLFGMGNQNQNSTRSLFSSPVQNQSAPSLFGASQPASTPAPAMGMFGSPAAGSTNAFGSPNQPIPSFDSSALTPAPAPAFNFGAQQSQLPVVFGFGQQAQGQQQQPQQQIYNFGGATSSPQLGMAAAPQVQFSIGSAPANRRMRKAVRRNPQR